eukprot:Gb_20181 [translate_table: standard]
MLHQSISCAEAMRVYPSPEFSCSEYNSIGVNLMDSGCSCVATMFATCSMDGRTQWSFSASFCQISKCHESGVRPMNSGHSYGFMAKHLYSNRCIISILVLGLLFQDLT